MKTFDCPPTLTDRQVIDFCRQGYLKLEAAVPADVTRRILDYLRDMDPEDYHQPNGLLDEDWFVEGLVLNPQTTGAVRSLMGTHFGLPPLMANHPGRCPEANRRIGPYPLANRDRTREKLRELCQYFQKSRT